MFYKRFGSSKRWLVFLHGWGADHKSFLWLKDIFEEEYSLLFVDFAGFGLSDKPEFKLSLNDYVNDLKKLLEKFEIDSLTFIAHSFGGRVAIKFLFYYQFSYNHVSLCLIDSAGLIPRRGFRYWWNVRKYKRFKVKSEKNNKLKAKLEKFGSDDYRQLDSVMKQTFISVVNEDLTDCAKFIKCKTIIIWGDNDKDTKLYMGRKFRKYINGSKLIILRNAGHFSFLEKKEDFVIILDTFLKNL